MKDKQENKHCINCKRLLIKGKNISPGKNHCLGCYEGYDNYPTQLKQKE